MKYEVTACYREYKIGGSVGVDMFKKKKTLVGKLHF